MKRLYVLVLIALVGTFVSGCATPAKKVKNLQLGMTPEEVTDKAGSPNTIRAAKVFEDGKTNEIWEYWPNFFQLNPETFWVYFENGKVVQWGQPGDFTKKSGNVPVEEYKPVRSTK